MNLYSNKQRWKIVLVIAALLIVGGTIWYASYIASEVQDDEVQDVKAWSEAIKKKADLVKVTNQSFKALKDEERRKVQLWAKATKELQKDLTDYSFAMEVIRYNSTMPLILTDENNNYSSTDFRNK